MHDHHLAASPPRWGCDGGHLLRSNERGLARQVMIDPFEGGVAGGIRGEGRGNRGWREGGRHRYRNVAVRELTP